MNKKLSTLMLAAAALLASCSQDDALQSTVNENEGLKPVTISVSLPEGMTTRAGTTLADDAKDKRCFVQILDSFNDKISEVQEMEKSEDGYTKTVYLEDREYYTFLFWADSDENGTAPDDLQNITYNNNGTVNAWAGYEFSVYWIPDMIGTGIECNLKHVVTRITLETKTDFTVSENQKLTIQVPGTYSVYNIAKGGNTGATSTYIYDCPDGTYTAGSTVGHFYVMGDVEGDNLQNLTLKYGSNPSITISNVPIKANTHVTLEGDIANAGPLQGTLTTTVDDAWETDKNAEISD